SGQQRDEFNIDSDLEDGDHGIQTPPKKKRKKDDASSSEKKKVFQTSWLSMPQYQGWLQQDPKGDPLYFCCRACGGKRLKGGKTEIDRHGGTLEHQKCVRQLHGTKSIATAFQAQATGPAQQHRNNVKKAEINIAAIFAEHNIPIHVVDNVVDVFKKVAPDSAILKDVTLDRTKCTAVLTNVVAKTEIEETVQNIKNCPFSILVDESPDVSHKKNFCVIVKYVDPKTNLIRTDLLHMIELDPKDCSAEKIFGSFENLMKYYEIPITNIIGLACDNANVMIGVNNSFYSRLKALCPWLVLLNCICHSCHLVSAKACAKLPPEIKKLLSETTNYIANSPKRQAELQEFQEFYDEKYGKLKRLSFTRWLVLQGCVERFLAIRRILEHFFTVAAFEDKKQETQAGWIFAQLGNPFTIAYLYFLKYSLEFFVKFNAFFQSKKPIVQDIARYSEKMLKQICQNYMKPENLKNVATLNLSTPGLQLPIEEIYLGPECHAALDGIPLPDNPEGKLTDVQLANSRRHEILKFRLRCLDFYTTAAKEIQSTFPIGKPFFKELEFLDPAMALDEKVRSGYLKDLGTVSNNFKNKLEIDPCTVAFEWRTLPGLIDADQKDRLLKLDSEEFWKEIANLRNYEDKIAFPQVTKLAQAGLILPHSNADAERIFSVVTDVKCKKRNRMGNRLLNAICAARTALKSKGQDCVSFKVTESHLSKHNANMYVNGPDPAAPAPPQPQPT
ncbi:hypothetical protein FOCC_FOCC000408, partial [Frankliniella occidentalis]